MNTFLQKIKPIGLLYFALTFELINLSYFWLFFKENYFLPAPFVSDKNDTFMDFYNPLYWVIKGGFYTTYNLVYPPINYYFLKIFSLGIPPEIISSPFQLRSDYLNLGLMISFLYVLIVWIVVNIGQWSKIHFFYRCLIFIVFLMSVPVLFELERGNLILTALPFLALYVNAKNPWAKAFFSAC